MFKRICKDVLQIIVFVLTLLFLDCGFHTVGFNKLYFYALSAYFINLVYRKVEWYFNETI